MIDHRMFIMLFHSHVRLVIIIKYLVLIDNQYYSIKIRVGITLVAIHAMTCQCCTSFIFTR